MTTADLNESWFQARAGAERIKPVHETEVHKDHFRVSIPVQRDVRGVAHEQLAAFGTVLRLRFFHLRVATHEHGSGRIPG